MNNAIYVKTTENLRNKIDVKLVNNEKDYLKYTSNQAICRRKYLKKPRKNDDSIKLSKITYIRVVILELSKILMYQFHYDYIKNKYDNKSKLFFTDTDSLMYEIKSEDVYEDFSSNKEMFDFSNYSTKSKYYDDSNNLVIGKMKDETGGVALKNLLD